jgi:hypothetical protein
LERPELSDGDGRKPPRAVGTQLFTNRFFSWRRLSIRSLRLKVGRERNHDIGRFGLMRREAGLSGIFPAGKLDYFPRLYPRPARLCGLHNVEGEPAVDFGRLPLAAEAARRRPVRRPRASPADTFWSGGV